LEDRNIRSVVSYLRSMPDWTEFNSCFEPSKIRISDIDGIVERKGEFLVLDMKGPQVPMNQGQMMLYRAMQQKRMTVVIIRGTTTHDIPNARCKSGAEAMIVDLGRIVVQSLHILADDGSERKIEPATNSDLHNFIRAWYIKANSKRT